MNRFPISNAEYLYVLSTFVVEPLRWNERFGWRKLSERERQSSYMFWREVGRRMNIKEIPPSLEAMIQYHDDYEDSYFQYTESNRRVADPTMRLLLGKFLPGPLWKLGVPFVCAVLDDPLLRAMGYRRPPAPLRWLVIRSLKLRAKLLWLMPRRRRPVVRTQWKRASYPNGYKIEDLGTRDER